MSLSTTYYKEVKLEAVPVANGIGKMCRVEKAGAARYLELARGCMQVVYNSELELRRRRVR